VQYLYDGGSAEGYRANYEQTFAYDVIGNLVKKTSKESKTQQVRNGMELNYDFNYEYYENSHRAERIGDMYYRYDGNGNVVEERYGGHSTADTVNAGYRYEDGIYSTDYGFALTRPDSGSSGTDSVYERRYTWDYRNPLLRTKDNRWTVNYRYGHDGQRRVKYTEETRNETLYFNNMWQTGTNGNGSEWLQSKHIFVGESRIATKSNKEIAGKTEGNLSFETEHQYWYHSDHLGSAQLTTTRSGELHERIEYTPYGEIWVEHKYDPAEGSLPYRFTGKELDEETGYYYYGARYLDPRTSRWISTDPAVGDYIPSAPVDDEAKKRNGNLPGMGGVFNVVNMHVYHYAGNNPVKYIDPDGKNFYNFTDKEITVMNENGDGVLVKPGEMYKGKIDGAFLDGETILNGKTIIKVSDKKWIPVNVDVVVETIDGKDTAFLVGGGSIFVNAFCDLFKKVVNIFRKDKLSTSGVYEFGSEGNAKLNKSWKDARNAAIEGGKKMNFLDKFYVKLLSLFKQQLKETD
jgi:RHS repeat-associated protein